MVVHDEVPEAVGDGQPSPVPRGSTSTTSHPVPGVLDTFTWPPLRAIRSTMDEAIPCRSTGTRSVHRAVTRQDQLDPDAIGILDLTWMPPMNATAPTRTANAAPDKLPARDSSDIPKTVRTEPIAARRRTGANPHPEWIRSPTPRSPTPAV